MPSASSPGGLPTYSYADYASAIFVPLDALREQIDKVFTAMKACKVSRTSAVSRPGSRPGSRAGSFAPSDRRGRSQTHGASTPRRTGRGISVAAKPRPEALKAAVGAVVDDVQGLYHRDGFALLNKLTAQRYMEIHNEIVAMFHRLYADTVHDSRIRNEIYTDFVDIIFDKACLEEEFSPLYARLCNHLVNPPDKIPVFVDMDREEEIQAFNPSGEQVSDSKLTPDSERALLKMRLTRSQSYTRRLIIQRVQRLFEEGENDTSLPVALQITSAMDDAEKEYILEMRKRRRFGNIRFIGELFLIKLIKPGIILSNCLPSLLLYPELTLSAHTTITEEEEKLFDDLFTVEYHERWRETILSARRQPENLDRLESACRLLETTGAQLLARLPPQDLNRSKFDAFIDLLDRLSNDTASFPARLRFMMHDTVTLARAGFPQRESVHVTAATKTLDDVRAEVLEDAAPSSRGSSAKPYSGRSHEAKGRDRSQLAPKSARSGRGGRGSSKEGGYQIRQPSKPRAVQSQTADGWVTPASRGSVQVTPRSEDRPATQRSARGSRPNQFAFVAEPVALEAPQPLALPDAAALVDLVDLLREEGSAELFKTVTATYPVDVPNAADIYALIIPALFATVVKAVDTPKNKFFNEVRICCIKLAETLPEPHSVNLPILRTLLTNVPPAASGLEFAKASLYLECFAEKLYTLDDLRAAIPAVPAPVVQDGTLKILFGVAVAALAKETSLPAIARRLAEKSFAACLPADTTEAAFAAEHDLQPYYSQAVDRVELGKILSRSRNAADLASFYEDLNLSLPPTEAALALAEMALENHMANPKHALDLVADLLREHAVSGAEVLSAALAPWGNHEQPAKFLLAVVEDLKGRELLTPADCDTLRRTWRIGPKKIALKQIQSAL
jgi:hypothetical protein